MQYRITHRYTSMRDGNRYGPWTAGTVVDLDPAVAAWINTDSPGTCVPDEPAPEPEPEAPKVTEPTAGTEPETTATGDAETSGEPDGEKAEDGAGEATGEQLKPPVGETKSSRNRAHTPARTRKSA